MGNMFAGEIIIWELDSHSKKRNTSNKEASTVSLISMWFTDAEFE